MRVSVPIGVASLALLALVQTAALAEGWTLDSQVVGQGKRCTLSHPDQGRTFSVALSTVPQARDEALVGLLFDEPALMKGAKKGLATVEFDSGAIQNHRIETTPSGTLLLPMVTLDLPDLLATLGQSKNVTVTTRFGSASFDLRGLAAQLPALRACAEG